MNASGLSDYQLYQLSKNHKLDNAILLAVNEEIKKRNLSEENLELISYRKEKDRNNKPYSPPAVYILILFPVVWLVHVYALKKYDTKNQKWNKYWLYFLVGILLWTVAIILWARFFIINKA